MKKKILVVAMLAVFASIAATGTLAYFTTEQSAVNVITSGGINIEIVERTKAEDGAEVQFPEEGISNVMPGTSASKIVRIKNTGVSDAWIRVKMESKIVSADGQELPLEIGENEKKPVMECEVLDGWVDGKDGYYYYENPVKSTEADNVTTELIKEVKFNPAMGNEYQGCTANIMISAQAVQKANNGDTVMEAKGWPETMGE